MLLRSLLVTVKVCAIFSSCIQKKITLDDGSAMSVIIFVLSAQLGAFLVQKSLLGFHYPFIFYIYKIADLKKKLLTG